MTDDKTATGGPKPSDPHQPTGQQERPQTGPGARAEDPGPQQPEPPENGVHEPPVGRHGHDEPDPPKKKKARRWGDEDD